MLKRIISAIVALSMLIGALPVLAASDTDLVLFSEGFEGYAENERKPSSLKIVSGLDSRVVTDGGNKAFYARALGESVNFSFSVPSSDARETVMSVKAKITGAKTSGKLFNATISGSKVSFVNLDDDGNLKLYDGTVLCAMPKGGYKTLTVHAKWKKKVFSVYVDKKCVAYNWSMPSPAANKSPTAIEFIVEYNEKSETEFFADDFRVYEGSKMPWDMKFPKAAANNEVLEFTPTTDFDPNAVRIIKDFDYKESTGLMFGNITSEISTKTLDDGTKVMHWSSPEEKSITNGFADMSLPELLSYSKFIFDYRIKINELTGSSKVALLDFRDTAGQWTVRGFEIGSSGKLVADIGGGSASIPFGEWFRLTFAYNMKTGKIGIYVNGEFVSENTTTAGATPVYFRYDVISPAGSKMDVYFDWCRIYGGDVLLDDSHFSQDPVFDTSTEEGTEGLQSIMDNALDLREALNGKTAFVTTNNSMYYDGKKEIITNEAEKLKTIDSVLMIPQATFEKINGDKPVVYTKETGEVSVGDMSTKDIIPVFQNGIMYLPLADSVEKLMNKKLSYDERGMAIIADTAVEVRTQHHYVDRHKKYYDYDLIYRYLIFDNPTGKEIVDTVIKNHPGNGHPRVYWTNEDIEYVLNKVDTDENWRNEYKRVINNADNLLYADLSSYYTVSDSGKHTAANRMQTMMTTLSTAHLLTGDPKYAKKGVEIMKGFASWASCGSHNLTLGHWADGMGIGFDSFYNYMMSTAEGRKDMQYIKERMVALEYKGHIDSYSKGFYNGPGWITFQDNFVGVIGGGLMCMLLAVCDEEDVRKDSEYLLENVLRSLYNAAELFYPDGGYYEGGDYGDLMMENFMDGMDALYNCCKTDYGMGNIPGFSDAGNAVTYLNSPNGRLNFHDDGGTYWNRFAAEFMGYRYGDVKGALMGRYSKRNAGKDHTINYSLKGLYYFDKAMEGIDVSSIDLSDMPLDKYMYTSEVGTFRDSHNISQPTYVGFHAGWTNVPHDMLDLGEFAFIADGVQWAKDLGADDYSLPGYFNLAGYNVYRKRPEGENCLVLNPQKEVSSYYGQKVGAYAGLVDLDINKPRGAKAAYDLTEAYSRDASKYIRGYYFGDNRNSLIVQDEVSLKGETEAYWFMHTPADITIVDNTKAILSKDGKTLTVDVYCNIPGYELKVMDPKPLPTSPDVSGQKKNEGYRKLAVHHPSASGELVISVKLSPNDDYAYTPLEYKPISEWTIPEGNIPERPYFKGIYLDGKEIYRFSPGVASYNITLPYGTTEIPKVTAVSSGGTVEIVQADSLSGTAIATIKSEGFKDNVCKIKFNVSNDRPIKVKKALSSINPTVGTPSNLIKPEKISIINSANDGANLVDGDFATSVSLADANDWIEFDFGKVIDISGVAVAFAKGDSNVAAYEILYSEDGTNFVKVYDGLASGMTKEYETLEIASKARYIRLVGKGNNAAVLTTNITEFRAYK